MANRTLTTAPESKLLKLARKGDHDAWNELVNRHREHVVDRLPCPRPDAEDKVQDALGQLWEHKHRTKLDPNGSFRGILYRRAHWDTQSYWRKQERHRKAEEREFDPQKEICQPAPKVELRIRLNQALLCLPDSEAAAFQHQVEGGSGKEFENERGVSRGAFYARVSRAKERLRKELDEDFHLAM